MADPAQALFDSMTNYARIAGLIDAGEAEGQYLECKAPGSPQLSREQRAQLAEAASGFANSGGGVMIWGVSTVRHDASGLDVLTQIEPVGHARRLAQQIDTALPTLTTPRLALQASKVLHPSRGDTKGVVVTYIPPSPGDPVQSTVDRHFYFRSGDKFHEMPYEMLQRMFAGAQGPLLRPLLDERLVKCDERGMWRVPVVLTNESTAAARDANVAVSVENAEVCASSSGEGLSDVSGVNPGRRVFTGSVGRPIFRGLDQLVGWLVVEMKKGRRLRRILRLRIRVFADRMRATEWSFKLQLAKTGFSIKDVQERFVY